MNTLLTALLLGPLAALHAHQPTAPQRPAAVAQRGGLEGARVGYSFSGTHAYG